MNAAIDMTLGRKMNYRPRLILWEQTIDQRSIAKVALNEDMSGVAFEWREVLSITGISQGIKVDDPLIRRCGVLEPLEDEMTADETGATRDQYHLSPFHFSIFASGAIKFRRELTDFFFQRIIFKFISLEKSRG